MQREPLKKHQKTYNQRTRTGVAHQNTVSFCPALARHKSKTLLPCSVHRASRGNTPRPSPAIWSALTSAPSTADLAESNSEPNFQSTAAVRMRDGWVCSLFLLPLQGCATPIVRPSGKLSSCPQKAAMEHFPYITPKTESKRC